jgi:hypothetical protein
MVPRRSSSCSKYERMDSTIPVTHVSPRCVHCAHVP